MAQEKRMQVRIIDCSAGSHLECVRQVTAQGAARPACIAAEHSMDVYVNERLAMRVVCTPEHLDELAVGRLLTEGLIETAEDIQEICICEKGQRVQALIREEAAARLTAGQAESVGACCTDNRTLLSGNAAEIKPVKPIPWQPGWLRDMAERLRREEPLYGATHAAHACYLALEGQALCCREDIGRHNALDKVIGWALMAGVDRARCMLFTTGRMPADMVAKALRAGIPLLASKTYPTDRGLELARRGRLTLATVRPDGTTLIWTNGQETEGPEEK